MDLLCLLLKTVFLVFLLVCNVTINNTEVSLSFFVFSRSAYQMTPAVLKRFCGYVAWVHTHTHRVIALIISCFLFAHKDLGPSPESQILVRKDRMGERENQRGEEGDVMARLMIV